MSNINAESPYVSIVMAVKDTAPYLPDCLDSIIGQTFQDWELIAVNDHSTDDTPEILARYAAIDSRIRVFNSPGQRLIPALQEGFRHVLGTLSAECAGQGHPPNANQRQNFRRFSRHTGQHPHPNFCGR